MDNAPTPDLGIPPDWDGITAEWMTAALTPAFPGVKVRSVDLATRDDGTNRRARFALSYTGDGGPPAVFVKAADPAHAELNALTGGVFNEARLFGGTVSLPIEHPAVYHAAMDEPTLNFILVMEDITLRGAQPRDATTPMTPEQAADGVRSLAHLHSAFWDHRSDPMDLDWVAPFIAWKGMRGIEAGLRRVADTVPAEIRSLTAAEIEQVWSRYIGTLTAGPQTLLHGDAHIGNTYTLPGNQAGFLDWQVLRRGNHVIDLGYFLQSALTAEDRRTHEADLIDEYHQALQLPADERPTRDDIWLRYRASAAHGLAIWLATASADTWQRPEVSIPLAQRYAAAYVDLDTADAVNHLS
ncbi:phosphotransferase [Frankia sp. AgB1.9]|uniref:phosphotransferase n=1 Tax=unclassified Frankia TaxID=2632575 RepID=UPI001934A539|nr:MULTISPECIES: phosphotransferase [unclassified Frankia]MBL7489964.1 phosphotransferase [Frankia sp. AgW1.1]MBL7552148.1 phosphotransferase [Frankia sp. AgB1.9]MBL7625255.1 phosphotransferase [Frankia sp. AgB1.8]